MIAGRDDWVPGAHLGWNGPTAFVSRGQTQPRSQHFAHLRLSGRVQFVNMRIRGNLGDNAPWNGPNCPLFHCHKAQIAADISKSFQLGENHEKFINSCRYHELGNLSLWQRVSFDSLWKRKLSIFCPRFAAISESLGLLPDRLWFRPDFTKQPSHWGGNTKKWTKRPYLQSGTVHWTSYSTVHCTALYWNVQYCNKVYITVLKCTVLY